MNSIEATTIAMNTLTLLNHAMSTYGLESFPFISYEVVFKGEDLQPQVWVSRLGDQLAEYYINKDGLITKQEMTYTDWKQRGRDLENFDMHTKGY